MKNKDQTHSESKVIYKVPSITSDTYLNTDKSLKDGVPLVIIDTETTGVGENDTIIEISMIKVHYSPSAGKIYKVIGTFEGLQQPPEPLTEDIIRITKLSDEDLEGKSISEEEVKTFLEGGPIMIAHNAGFDRPKFDKQFPSLSNLRWGCTLKGVCWDKIDNPCLRLDYLLWQKGWYYEGHRALNDCEALLMLLYSDKSIIQEVIEGVTEGAYLVEAVGNTYSVKDDLKSAGFYWCDGNGGRLKGWRTLIPSGKANECKGLLVELYSEGKDAIFTKLTSRDMYK